MKVLIASAIVCVAAFATTVIASPAMAGPSDHSGGGTYSVQMPDIDTEDYIPDWWGE